MTMHTTGWVEVRDPYHFYPTSLEPDPHAHWEPVIRLLPLISWYLVAFGHTIDWPAVYSALHSGLPTDVSLLVEEAYSADQAEYGELAFPPVWGTWSTWQALDWKAPAASDWEMFLRILGILAQRYGEDNVRVIFWTVTNM